MQVVKIQSKIDPQGRLQLDVPTHLPSSLVDVVVVIQPIEPTPSPNKPYDFSDLSGKLEWTGDAVSVQKQLRNEW